MLTKRENFLETIHGGSPEHFVDNFEYLTLFFDPISLGVLNRGNVQPDVPFQNAWGVWELLGTDEPGVMPLCDDEHKLIKDVCEWQSYLNEPRLIYSDEEWAPCIEQVNAIDRNETFAAPFLANGIFEKLHYFMGMEDAMCNFYEEPEAMVDLIEYISDFEVKQAEEIVRHVHPDAIFHHDDWGSQRNSFLSPEMFDEFIKPAYDKIYGFWKENGVEVLVHHSDSYAANLVPSMIDMGIDVWQGAIRENDLPALVGQYGGQISFMGGLNNGIYDKPETTADELEAGFRELLDACPNQGRHFLIPGLTMGEPGSVFKHVYPLATEVIYKLSAEYFA
ncbi:MAG: uroporphyrinogen decarboxylase family protein [Coriobacteriales bacterium]